MKISESSQTENRYTDNRFIMLPTVDVCFKGLMNNPIVRKGFIAALLKADPETIAETTLLPTILHQDYPDDKLGILDVRVLMENGTQIDMEMQVAYFEYWDARVLFYLSRIFTDQLRKGESYENLKKCIHVSILDFIHFKEDDKCHRTICCCDEKTGRKYTDLMEIQILELRKLPENLKNGSEVLLTRGCDDICRKCPNNRKNMCCDGEKVKSYDSAVISSCNLDFDKVYEYGCLYSLVENNIIKKDMLRLVCGDCQWFHICGTARV